MKFSDIPAHDEIKKHLTAMADDNRLPHALMLHGVPGIGKMALARALVQYIHCTNRTADGDSCGCCPSCLQHQSLNHIDTIYSYPIVKAASGKPALSDDFAAQWRDYLTDNTYMNFRRWHELLGKTNTQPQIYVDESREMLRKISTTAHASAVKFVIIWLPERMGENAANAMLKIIEEPYADTKFILVSDAPSQVLPTIMSRCQAVEVPPYADSIVAGILEREHGVEASQARMLAHISEGSMAEALRQLGGDKELTLYLDLFISLMRLAYQRNVGELRNWSVKVSDLGRESEMKFYAYCQRLIRENFIYNFNQTDLVCLNSAEAQFSSRFARFINERNAERMADAFAGAQIDIAGNGNGKIVNFELAIRIILLLK